MQVVKLLQLSIKLKKEVGMPKGMVVQRTAVPVSLDADVRS